MGIRYSSGWQQREGETRPRVNIASGYWLSGVEPMASNGRLTLFYASTVHSRLSDTILERSVQIIFTHRTYMFWHVNFHAKSDWSDGIARVEYLRLLGRFVTPKEFERLDLVWVTTSPLPDATRY